MNKRSERVITRGRRDKFVHQKAVFYQLPDKLGGRIEWFVSGNGLSQFRYRCANFGTIQHGENGRVSGYFTGKVTPLPVLPASLGVPEPISDLVSRPISVKTNVLSDCWMTHQAKSQID